MYHGIINIKKEKGYTSHDVVARLRGILRQKKIGHTGTLDPEAEGVLPVCLGQGTKLCDMLTDHSKEYCAVLHLGVCTDTEDMTGTVLETRAVTCSEEEVRSVVESFVGSYEQIPPMYSAIKVNGKKLYELARAGKSIERKARLVEITEIQIEEIALPRVRLRVACSKGTYIRSLCRDIGEKLGCGGCMEELLRTRVGSFCLPTALTLDEVEKLQQQGNLEGFILPLDEACVQYPAVSVKEEGEKALKNGNPLHPSCLLGNEETAKEIRVYDGEGKFTGIYAYRREKGLYFPQKMFLDRD